MTVTLINHPSDIFAHQGIPVIPTNTQGIMGAGLAGQYAKRDPQGYAHYRERCKRGEHTIGTVMMVKGEHGLALCFPTMVKPGERASLANIKAGARDMAAKLAALPASWDGTTFLIPRLGCGIGRLNDRDVLAAMQQALAPIEDRFTFGYIGF